MGLSIRNGLMARGALLLAALGLPATLLSATIFSENMGTPSATTAVASNTFQNGAPVTFAAANGPDVRITNASTTALYSRASGGGNIFFSNTSGVDRSFTISGINTSNHTGITLKFGVRKSTIASTGADFTVAYSTNGTDFTAVSYPALPTGSGTATWHDVTATTSLPASSTLTLRFLKTAAGSTEYRLDDILIEGTPVPTGDDPDISVASSLNFGSILSSATSTQTLTVTNNGTTNGLTIANASSISGPDAARFTLNTALPLTINPGASTDLSLTFDPAGNAGTFAATLTLNSNDATNPSVAIALSGSATAAPKFAINEIHADPSATLGDANGDGTIDASQDEFVEFVNVSGAPVDISGWTVRDAVALRHTFPAGTVVAAGRAVVVFGGGTPTGCFGDAIVQTASTGTLGLNNTGDTVQLRLADDTTIDVQHTYGAEAGADVSINRDPELTGAFVQHDSIAAANAARYSPGRRADGSQFLAIAPTVPTALALLAADDTGASDSDRLTNVATPRITGTGTTGETVNLLVNGNAAGSAVVDGSGSWTITSTASLTAGSNSITATASRCAGAASAASSALTINYDATAPTLSGVTMASNNANSALARSGDTITVSFTASETLAAAPTVTIAGAAATVQNTGSDYTATVTVAGGTAEGTAAFSIAGLVDAAGNTGSTVTTLSSGSAVVVDTTAPVILSTSPAFGATVSALTDFSVTFSEPVSGVAASQLTVGGSAATAVTGTGAGPYVFSGFAAPADGVVSISLAGTATDAAGNAFAGVTNETVTLNGALVPLAITVAGATAGGTAALTAPTVTFTFGADVTGFDAGDVAVTNGTIGTLSGSGSVYTSTLTPGQGVVEISVAAAAATGTAAPNNGSAGASFSFTNDTVAPVSSATAAAFVIGTQVAVDFTANDAMSGVASVVLEVKAPGSANFVASGLTATGSQFVYTAAAAGRHEFRIIATDAAGNVETKVAADAVTIVNTTANGALTLDVPAGSNVAVTFPMTTTTSATLTFANVTSAGTVTVQRVVGDGGAAAAGLDPNRLAGQSFVITAGGALAFDTVTITFRYDDALLGSALAESAINAIFRVAGSVVTTYGAPAVTVDTAANTATVTGVTGFSEWFIGDADAPVADWAVVGAE